MTGAGIPTSGWPALFWEAFRHSRNAMVLLDERRLHVEVNGAYVQLLGYQRSELIGRPVYELVAGGPQTTPQEWRALLRRRQFTGVADLLCANGSLVTVEFAGHPEVVTGQRRVLLVALRTARGRRRLPDGARPNPEAATLSDRESQVVALIADGLSGPEIAGELRLSHNTVRTHVSNAMSKLGARSRAQLVARSVGEGRHWRRPA